MSHFFTDRSQTSRFFLSAFPAIGLTFVIFLGMQALIKSDEVVLKPSKFRGLSNIVLPEIADVFPVEPETPVLIKAPVPPKVNQIENTSSKSVHWEVVEPASFDPIIPQGSLKELTRFEVALDRQTAEAIRRPVPVYPEAALRKGLSGQCDVEFSIDQLGRPFGVEAKCSDNVFRRSAEQAVRKALFAARTQKGVPVGQENLVYPLLYELND